MTEKKKSNDLTMLNDGLIQLYRTMILNKNF